MIEVSNGKTNIPPMQKTMLRAIFWRFGRLRLFKIGNGAMAIPQSLKIFSPALLNLHHDNAVSLTDTFKTSEIRCAPDGFLVQAFALCVRVDRSVPEEVDWHTGENGIAARPNEEQDHKRDQASVDLAKP